MESLKEINKLTPDMTSVVADSPVHNKVISDFQALRQARVQGGGARTCNRKVPTDLRVNPLATVPPTPQAIVRASLLAHWNEKNTF
ncbi:hypothetical protein PoB_002842000 [Plakobranchus ocellatus]|uniref:Uncharacterized protein n=1 Tax=Plakobranchus ocellatus TaxID=259542 RepID=A0AAV4A190_9GAST|nr:hypothetical protein PoB_002842000 [Plakobranchus ocellatus]